MPLHLQAKKFSSSGLFSGISSFSELESRIAAIKDLKEKGDAFEVFAEAYLATQLKHEYKEYWPLASTPEKILTKLKLPLKDYGVDGIGQTPLGSYQAVQVKFRSGRASLTWEDLSTFMGLSDSPEITAKVVVTNCDDLPALMNDRHNFFCVRGSDLERMSPADFSAIEAWLTESEPILPRKSPKPHQQEALDAILPALRTSPRTTAIMACGTGKTLVTLWTAEQMGAHKVLVLLPSLALLRQTLHEWRKETSLSSLAYLCVCSDSTVKGEDEINMAQSELDFEVTTSSETVRRFLDAPFSGVKVIFSTYQSSFVIGDALLPGESFDLGIFDEAHKTAGREGRSFGYALEDKNIQIEKRLFVTATPRHYNSSKRNKDGDALLAFSMDAPKVYGDQSYVLTFSRAAKLDLICGYKVIISVISSPQTEGLTNSSLSKGLVRIGREDVVARQVANQIALSEAHAKYGVTKVFTFHSSVKSAASFVENGPEGVGTHLPDFEAFHVSGEMSAARRERLLTDFKNSPRAVISNARCLTEGIDVPAVDMVAFMSPKKSIVDIIQTVGRAMRKSGDKEFGYILIPLYLEQDANETLEDAVERANFGEVWNILQALKEQDEVLADLIKDMAEAKGRGKGYDDSKIKKRIEFIGVSLSIDSIRQAITTKVLENLELSWDVSCGKLEKFKSENGHCRVPAVFPDDQALGTWVGTQRTNYSKGELSKGRIARLEAIGFEWDPYSVDWELNFSKVEAFKKNNGHCRVPRQFPDDQALGIWGGTQRANYSKGKLSKERADRLEAIGFEWDPYSVDWELNFSKLEKFKSERGHCRVPSNFADDLPFARWIGTQRRAYSKGKLTPERIARLEAIGFEWDLVSSDWEINFSKLKAFKKENGHCRVPSKLPADQSFATWTGTQRTSYSKGELSKERINRLEAIGFEWEPYSVDWELNFSKLEKFKSEHGHCRVPRQFPDDQALGIWGNNQRSNYSKGKLSKGRADRLEAIGFELAPFFSDWELNFSKVEAFKKNNGHCRVPYRFPDDQALGTWVGTQRKNYSKGKLSKERADRLEAIGFEWDPYSVDWELNFSKLEVFKEENGHCRVPQRFPGDRALGFWGSTQRTNYSKGKLTQERITRLELLGFEFRIAEGSPYTLLSSSKSI